jgi:hypothetical protein
MTTYIYSYNPYSASAKALARSLGIKRIKREGSNFRGKSDKTVINWGNSTLPVEVLKCGWINDPDDVARVSNKLSFFQMMGEGELVVPWTTDQVKVRQWLSDGKTVVARTKLSGHSGEGIVLIEREDADIPNAPLYTLYVPKKDEYRVHCYRDSDDEVNIFDIQKKMRKSDILDDQVNYKVRNLDGGFIYARNDIVVPDCVKECALEIFRQTGLDFGAIDIIYNQHYDRAYGLEVNTAPGLTGTTLEKYVDMFRRIV